MHRDIDLLSIMDNCICNSMILKNIDVENCSLK